MTTVYRDEILEHYKDPNHFGKLKQYTTFSKLTNPFCGDEIEIFLDIKNNIVEDISFQGKGCAISIASTSMLTEYVIKKSKKQLTRFSENDILSLLGIEISENRKKCAFLGLSALQDSLNKIT